MQIIGIDIGFGFTKATDGKETVIFKSLYGDSMELQYWGDFGENKITDFFHVSIDGHSYFIGDLAEQQSTVRHFTLDQEKLISGFVKILAVTAAGIFMSNADPVNVPINIVSGLPIGYFKRNHKRFNEILMGHHKIIYYDHEGQGKTKELYINKVRMLPQPLGSVLNLLMDDRGQLVNAELAKQKIGVVDIGFRTTDFTILDRLRYIDRGSRTMDTGISKAFGVIANKFRENFGVNVELYRLYNAVEKGKIKLRGREFDFSSIKDQVYSQLAARIANDIDRLWDEDWDIDTIVLTGGGCMDLSTYLQPMIAGNVLPVPNDVDARLNNVQGYMKYGKYVSGKVAVKESEPQPAVEAL